VFFVKCCESLPPNVKLEQSGSKSLHLFKFALYVVGIYTSDCWWMKIRLGNLRIQTNFVYFKIVVMRPYMALQHLKVQDYVQNLRM
jgi:hypothetical protein